MPKRAKPTTPSTDKCELSGSIENLNTGEVCTFDTYTHNNTFSLGIRQRKCSVLSLGGKCGIIGVFVHRGCYFNRHAGFVSDGLRLCT